MRLGAPRTDSGTPVNAPLSTPGAAGNPSQTAWTELFLMPGQHHLSALPMRVATILGSCVSVTLFHPPSRTGAICHGLLPHCSCESDHCRAVGCRECFRYVDCAILHLLEQFDRRRCPRHELVVKLFGGADLLPTDDPENTIGRQNVRIARLVLENEGLRIHAADVGGNQGRKLHFFTHTGEVHLRRFSHRERGLSLTLP